MASKYGPDGFDVNALPESVEVLVDRDEQKLPTIDEVLACPFTHQWLKDALISALKKDPVDVANDAELLAALLTARADKMLHSDILNVYARHPHRSA